MIRGIFLFCCSICNSVQGSFLSKYAQVNSLNSASYPQRDGKWVIAHKLRGQLTEAVVCLRSAPRVLLLDSTARAGTELRYHQFVPIARHYRNCSKALLISSLTHVSNAAASTRRLRPYLYLHRSAKTSDETEWTKIHHTECRSCAV